MIAIFDRDATACACDPAEGVELATEGAYVVGGVFGVGGGDEIVAGRGGAGRHGVFGTESIRCPHCQAEVRVSQWYTR